MIDFKQITLALYGQEVKVIFKSNTECYKLYGEMIIGKLIGRIWGKGTWSIVGVILLTKEGEINITCTEIETIEKA